MLIVTTNFVCHQLENVTKKLSSLPAFYIGTSTTTIAANTPNIVFGFSLTAINAAYNSSVGTVTSLMQDGIYFLQLAAGVCLLAKPA